MFKKKHSVDEETLKEIDPGLIVSDEEIDEMALAIDFLFSSRLKDEGLQLRSNRAYAYYAQCFSRLIKALEKKSDLRFKEFITENGDESRE